MDLKHSNAATLADNDAVEVFRNLPTEGSLVCIQRGSHINNIRLADQSVKVEHAATMEMRLMLRSCHGKVWPSRDAA